MDALVMCGGRGTRLREGNRSDVKHPEKPLVEVGGASMLSWVVDALRGSEVGQSGTIHAVVSPQAPETADRARDLSLPVIETPGEGYVSDLQTALGEVGKPAVTVPADLPLLAAEHVDDAMAAAREQGEESRNPASLTVCVPAALKRRLGASVDTAFDHEGREVAPTGVNVVAGDDDTVALTYDARLAVNVNRPSDRTLAEALCA